MNNIDRQLALDTRMYRKKTFGKEPYCSYCWAKFNGCIASAAYRSAQLQCVKAECRMKRLPFYLREVVEPKSYPHKLYGLKN